jgi:hypothetical protein
MKQSDFGETEPLKVHDVGWVVEPERLTLVLVTVYGDKVFYFDSYAAERMRDSMGEALEIFNETN